MKKLTYILAMIAVMICTASCSKDNEWIYDNSFIHIMKNEASSETINERGQSLGEYYIYLSSKQLSENLVVTYSITPGNGLVEGVDYKLITTAKELTFLPGVYAQPIRIQWLSHTIDATKDNSLTIRIESNNLGITMGLPGPDQRQRQYVITKIK